MSEQWKSVVGSSHQLQDLSIMLTSVFQPRYWCKHCKTFVRDTPLERRNHDATGKHQGAIARFLRDLQRGSERAERDAQRAKNEVARLTGKPAAAVAVERGRNSSNASSARIKATPEERRKQVAQLAEMGIEVPEEFRREMAMAGGWEKMNDRVVYEDDDERTGHGGDVKPSPLTVGVRKRRRENGVDDEEALGDETTAVGDGMPKKATRRNWGSSMREYPGHADDDLDALLDATRVVKKEKAVDVKVEEVDQSAVAKQTASLAATDALMPPVKREEDAPDDDIPAADETLTTGLFKKRKVKSKGLN